MLVTLLCRHMDKKVLHRVGDFDHLNRMDALKTPGRVGNSLQTQSLILLNG
jgi:hypothetical protein